MVKFILIDRESTEDPLRIKLQTLKSFKGQVVIMKNLEIETHILKFHVMTSNFIIFDILRMSF